MATKKGSKTAHVLNVLSNPKENPASDGSFQEAVEAQNDEVTQKAVHSRPVRVPILEVARANDEALSEQIRELLEEELIQGEDLSEDQAVEEEEKDGSPPPMQLELREESTPSQESSIDDGLDQELPDDFCYMNIMEALVEEKCMKYINMFGLCTCSRCVADVKALALSNLPPKYVVMHKGELIPMLTVFEGRFNSALTAQILNACKIVMEHPRHTLP